MKINNNTYFFSDPHYGHKNLVRGITNWGSSGNCRDFDTLEEHNDAIVNNINGIVPENATLFCLGDWSFGGIQNIWEFRKRINCKDIHLILGNHDHHIENNSGVPIPNNSDDERRFHEISDIWQPFAPSTSKRVDVYAHDLFSSVSHYKEISYKKNGYKYDIILSHYAMRVWNKIHYGSIMLYGHSHGTLDAMTPDIANPTWIGDKYYLRNLRTMDIGLDTNGLFPYHIDEIIDIMKDKPVGFEIDHHK